MWRCRADWPIPKCAQRSQPAGRNHDLTESEVSSACSDWELFWASMRPVEVSADVERAAGSLAAAHQYHGADAVHLAKRSHSARQISPVAVWDKRLHAGAAAAGLSVAPATLG